mgnify:FL=1
MLLFAFNNECMTWTSINFYCGAQTLFYLEQIVRIDGLYVAELETTSNASDPATDSAEVMSRVNVKPANSNAHNLRNTMHTETDSERP